jgi:class 3 adenylate cyclase
MVELRMGHREFSYCWEWRLKASPEALWPLVSDTNRFNHDAGLPCVERLPEAGPPLANARRRLRLFVLGMAVEWEEEPFEWIRPYRFGVIRRYTRGPVASVRVLAELTPQAEGETRLVYQVRATPRNLVGLLAIPLQIGLGGARRFDAVFRQYADLAAAGQLPMDLGGPPRLAPGGRKRLAGLRRDLLSQGPAPDLVARLVDTIERSDDLSLDRIRPYALADLWGAPRRATLELCLLATRAGLLDLRWDVICPLCRGAKQSSPTLGGVRSQVHCESCNIDFTANFDRSVELTFHPNPSVRRVECPEFCIGGPQVTPHVVAQQLLSPGAQRALTLPLEEGRHRLRTLASPGGQFLLVTPDGGAEGTFRVTGAGWSNDEPRLCPRPVLRLENRTAQEQLCILERMAWSDQAATAADVTALQRFRDLFASEVLRPGEEISVGSLTVVFTDLRGSTRLYREIGDATAFGAVMNHFDVLRSTIAEEEGALVKTIGDAVMAVFRRPVSALRAMVSAQQRLARSPGQARPLQLKAGMHSGPCIATTQNDRLDYFGSTVNIAARLGDLSSGNDVIISDALRTDPEVTEWLAQRTEELAAVRFEARLKGFDAERFALWRVAPPARLSQVSSPPPGDRG